MRIVKNNFKHNITLTKLENLAWINKNNLNKNQNEINYLDISNAKSGEILSLKHIIGKSNFPSRAKRIANAGDSVFSTVRPNLKGYAFIKENNIVVSSGFSVVSAKNKKYEKFLYYYLSSQKSLDWMMSICKGSNYPAFSPNDIKDCYIINIEENEAYNIGLIISYQEEQIKNIKQLIKKIETRNQYYAEKILSGELRVRKNENGKTEFYTNTEWNEIKINTFIDKQERKIPLGWEKGIFSEHSKFTVGTPLHSSLFNYNNQGLQYLRTGDVWENASSSKEVAFYNGDIDEKFIKKENDYLISLKGYNKNIGEGTLGLVTNYNNKKGIVCDNMYLVTPKEHNLVAYTAYTTKLNYIQNIILKTAVGSTARFATKMINKIEWIFPSEIEEMLLINSFFVSIDKEISSLKALLEKEQLRFQWLLDNLLSGEYQVVEE